MTNLQIMRKHLNNNKLVQYFDDDTADKICTEIYKQFVKAFRWLEKFEQNNAR